MSLVQSKWSKADLFHLWLPVDLGRLPASSDISVGSDLHNVKGKSTYYTL
jgi:hypothetical protein